MQARVVFQSFHCSALSAEDQSDLVIIWIVIDCSLETGLRLWKMGTPILTICYLLLLWWLWTKAQCSWTFHSCVREGTLVWVDTMTCLVLLCLSSNLGDGEQGDCWKLGRCFVLFVTDVRLKAGLAQKQISVLSSHVGYYSPTESYLKGPV